MRGSAGPGLSAGSGSGGVRSGRDGASCGSEGETSAVAEEMTLSSSAALSSHSQVMVGLQACERTSGFFSAGTGMGLVWGVGAGAGADVTGGSA